MPGTHILASVGVFIDNILSVDAGSTRLLDGAGDGKTCLSCMVVECGAHDPGLCDVLLLCPRNKIWVTMSTIYRAA